MADTENTIIAPPPKPVILNTKFNNVEDINSYFSERVNTYFSELYKHQYFIWKRTGGYSSTTSTVELLASLTNSKSNIGNVETDLLQYTLQSNLLLSIGDFVEIDAYGYFDQDNNDDDKTLRVYFGQHSIFNVTQFPNAIFGQWHIKIKVIRATSKFQKIVIDFRSDNPSVGNKFGFVDSSEDLSQNVNIKFTGIGSVNSDVVQEVLFVKLYRK